ncbi:hypothetical protein MKEN_01294600 [Mycena kentingensis (nom. inval.)]|nr:hypothetical protein MKEN_01294600 [Mycena kentingensis (nom. inval.)]
MQMPPFFVLSLPMKSFSGAIGTERSFLVSTTLDVLYPAPSAQDVPSLASSAQDVPSLAPSVRDVPPPHALGGILPPRSRETSSPGMYCSPVHAVPKPHSDKLRMIVDQSFGDYAPNSMISREAVAGAKLDSLQRLGDRLLELRRLHGPNADLVVWKSDVSQAYRRLPVHPLWQLKQIITIGEERRVDRCVEFRESGFRAYLDRIHGTRSLDRKRHLADRVEFYHPYRSMFPADQTATLQLWDELGIPHDRAKQLHGRVLPVIGFEVDTAAMTFSMADEQRDELVAAVEDFYREPPIGGRRRTLREFQRLAGWINWALNVYPLLRPALANVYAKTAGKNRPDARVHLSNGVANDLRWFADHVRAMPGIRLLESIDWAPDDADVIFSGAIGTERSFLVSTTLDVLYPAPSAQDVPSLASSAQDVPSLAPSPRDIIPWCVSRARLGATPLFLKILPPTSVLPRKTSFLGYPPAH